ncbi:MAG: ATP-binding protein [Bacteroidota bacterium]
MTISVKYFLFIIIIHGLITYLVFLLLQEQKGLFILSEVLILISLFLSYQIYVGFIKPIQFMASGVNALADQDYSVQYLRTNSRELNELIDVYNKMIINIREERIQLQEQHFFLQKLIQAYPAGVILLDYDEKIADINPSALSLLNLEHAPLGQSLTEIEHPLIQPLMSLKVGDATIIKGRGLEQFKCEAAQFVHRGFTRQFYLIQEMSKEIILAEKRAYGKVIRMMAHEVNNSIGAINSIIHSSIDYLSDSQSEDDQMIQEALSTAAARNENLAQFMKNFAEVVRLPKPSLQTTSLQKLVRNVSNLMEPIATQHDITFKYEMLESGDIKVNLDEQQMEQALVNIVKNAIEAIGEKGTIRFKVGTYPTCLIIANDGPPIPDDVAEKIFTPFFSTKQDGQGIGLTLVREIMNNHDASISLSTKEDGWTVCEIIF